MAINTFRGAAKQDEKYRTLKRLLKAGAFNIDVSARLEELKSLLATRKARSLTYKEVVSSTQKALVTAALDNMATRSRVVEVKVQCTEISSTLDDHLGRMVKHLKATYQSQLKASGFKTVQAQDDAVKHLLQDAYTLLRSVERIIKIADILINDIDQTGFSLTLVKNVLEVSTRPERNF